MITEFNLFTTKRFLPLFITQFLGAFNDNFFKNALVILIAFQESQILGLPPKEMVALCAAIFILPFFLFSAFAGVLADRLDKKYIARIVKLAEVCIMLLATYGFLSHHFSILLLCLFLMGAHSAFFGPVKYAILPQLLKTDELLNANAFVGAGTFMAILLGTVLGGLLISLGKDGLILVCMSMLGISLTGLISSWYIPSAPTEILPPFTSISLNIYQLSINVLKLSYENKQIFYTILCFSWFWFIGVAFLSLIPPYVKETLLGSQKKASIFLGLFTIGIAVGAFLCTLVSKNKINLKLVPTGGFILSFFSVLIGVLHLFFHSIISHHLIGLLFLLACVGGGLYSIPLITYIQKTAKITERSKIISACNIINAMAMVLSSQLIVILFKLSISIPAIFIMLGCLNLFILPLTLKLKNGYSSYE